MEHNLEKNRYTNVIACTINSRKYFYLVIFVLIEDGINVHQNN